MKKIILCLLMFVLTVSVFAGCSANDTSSESFKEPESYSYCVVFDAGSKAKFYADSSERIKKVYLSQSAKEACSGVKLNGKKYSDAVNAFIKEMIKGEVLKDGDTVKISIEKINDQEFTENKILLSYLLSARIAAEENNCKNIKFGY